jgi:endoglucanase
VFGYNAVRIPLYLAMSKMPGARDALQSYSGLWNVQDNVGPFVIDVRSGSAMEPLEAGGYRLIAAIADCIVKGAAIPTSAFAQSDAHYYPAALALLALLTFDEVYPECL